MKPLNFEIRYNAKNQIIDTLKTRRTGQKK